MTKKTKKILGIAVVILLVIFRKPVMMLFEKLKASASARLGK